MARDFLDRNSRTTGLGKHLQYFVIVVVQYADRYEKRELNKDFSFYSSLSVCWGFDLMPMQRGCPHPLPCPP
jgi:hypothetical protein